MRRSATDKRLAHKGGFFARARICKEGEKPLVKEFRTKGGGRKAAAEKVAFAQVSTASGVKKTKVLTVVQTQADPHFARENIIVKGAIIKTDLGEARVTSRPGQDGVVNAVLLKK